MPATAPGNRRSVPAADYRAGRSTRPGDRVGQLQAIPIPAGDRRRTLEDQAVGIMAGQRALMSSVLSDLAA
jgi:hypothetical protein